MPPEYDRPRLVIEDADPRNVADRIHDAFSEDAIGERSFHEGNNVSPVYHFTDVYHIGDTTIVVDAKYNRGGNIEFEFKSPTSAKSAVDSIRELYAKLERKRKSKARQ